VVTQNILVIPRGIGFDVTKKLTEGPEA
jgi:hypothetical protein